MIRSIGSESLNNQRTIRHLFREPRFQYLSIRIRQVRLVRHIDRQDFGTTTGLDEVWGRICSGSFELNRCPAPRSSRLLPNRIISLAAREN